jgi:uncharacterized protein
VAFRPRTYTYFLPRETGLANRADFFSIISDVYSRLQDNFDAPRTTRLVLPSISLDASEDVNADFATVAKWCDLASKAGFRWLNLPINISSDGYIEKEVQHVLCELLYKNQGLFASINIKHPQAIPVGSKIYANICKSLSRRDHKGFANFRFGIGFNIAESTPFFPFSFSDQEGLSVALESLPLFSKLTYKGGSLGDVRDALCEGLLEFQERIENVLGATDVKYLGADWSLAPLPNCDESVAALVEYMSGNTVGRGSTLSSVAKLTEILKAPLGLGVKGVGFNGVMLSVLEDDVLACRFRYKDISVNDLLLYSSVCGCGLDMVPIAGDTPEASIAAYAQDTGSMAFRLHKPLGVRFLPIAGLRGGQETEFSHDFVCNSGVAEL